MSVAVVIILILIVVLIFILYRYYSNTASTLQSTASLNGGALPAIPISDSPTSARYAYSIWVYVNTWDNQRDKILFSRNGNLVLTLDKAQPTLQCKVSMQDGTTQSVKLTDNFPIQKWVNIIVSFDGQFFDGYLNGKLVTSQRFGNPATGAIVLPANPPDKSVPVYLGYAGTPAYVNQDIYIGLFKRWTSPMDPQTAWNTYMSGNGQSTTSQWSAYGIDLSLLKNSVEQSRFSLF
jgi:hypothetical protein